MANCLTSILENTSDSVEVIAVDNGSSDEKFEESYLPHKSNERIRWIRTGANFPLGQAKNVGGRASKGKYVVYLDNDTVVAPGWFDPLIQCMEKQVNVGAVQCLLITPKNEIQHSGGIINSIGIGFSTHTIGLYSPGHFPREVFFAAGAGMAIRRDLLYQLGFYDPHITFTDDIDLSWRMNLLAKEVVLCPNSVVTHIGGKTSVSSETIKLRRQRYFSFELLHVSTKNYSAKYLMANLPKMFFLLSLMFAQRVRSKKPKQALAYVAGVLMYLKSFPSLWQERIAVQRIIRRISDDNLQKKMLLVNWVEMVKFGFSLLTGKKPVGPIGKIQKSSQR